MVSLIFEAPMRQEILTVSILPPPRDRLRGAEMDVSRPVYILLVSFSKLLVTYGLSDYIMKYIIHEQR